MTGWALLVDVVVILVCAFGAWRGYKDGVIAASANLVGLVVSLVAAFYFYAPMASLFLKIWTVPQSIANVFGFLFLAFVLDGVLTTLVMLLATKMPPQFHQLPITHWFGLPMGLINSLITVGYIASLFTGLPLEHPAKTAVEQSVLARPLIAVVNALGAPVDKLITPAINDLSQLFTIEPDSKDIVDLKFKVQDPQPDPEDEDGMLVLVNKERTSRGLPALEMDDALQKVARAHSLDMFQRGYFAHYTPEGLDPFDRMKAAGITYQSAGENLAMAPSLQLAHTGLMNSPGHRRNILDPSYRKIGIGAYKDPRYGIMFSQEFTN